MLDSGTPQVDLVVLARESGPLHPAVNKGIQSQCGVRIVVHRVVGRPVPGARNRWETIARARNEGKNRGNAPWLMFLDDDVVLHPQCVVTLVRDLQRKPIYAALAADYRGEYRPGQISDHVSMGATLFRRDALEQVCFRWAEQQCECQCCCNDLRSLHWAIDYCRTARARHLPKREVGESSRRHGPVHDDAVEGEVGRVRAERRRAAIPSVRLVVCYFGPPPRWIDRYLTSCAHNPSIDFLIFTDQARFPPTPTNVTIKRLNTRAFNALASDKLGFDVRLSRPYKLCDFKPTYGQLFSKYLEGWDYWGYTDFDVIYGDLRRFLSLARLQDYDVFTARREFLVGHFTLFRNNDRLRTLYRESRDYRATLQSDEMHSFSECGRQWRRRLAGKPLTDDAACDSMMHVICRLAAAKKISVCFSPAVIEWPDLPRGDWRVQWHAGRIWSIDLRREGMYFHFNRFKRRAGYCAPPKLDNDMAFEMTPSGFERASTPIKFVGGQASSQRGGRKLGSTHE